MADSRRIPSIEQLRQRSDMGALEARYGRDAVVDALRAAAAAMRGDLASPHPRAVDDVPAAIAADAERRVTRLFSPSLRRVINATGVIAHTNLGRAPLAAAALRRVDELCGGYVNLEYDIGEGVRGSRALHAESLLTTLTGAEASAVVNNNAAATLLMLAALAEGREVLISRGELVEIGGGFRIPDVMAQSGAILREVGTTNRTRLGDYAGALNERTAAILRVHPSNFRIEGFTERPSLEELARLGRQFNVPVLEDLGSGAIAPQLPSEPVVADSVRQGASVVCFSGDKLFGGPQAGILVGEVRHIEPIRRHPLMRALRVDKLTYAALEATLIEHLSGRAAETVPVLRMLAMTVESIDARARALAQALSAAGWVSTVIDGGSTTGGGSAPGVELPTRLVTLERPGHSAGSIEERLRRAAVPVIARILKDVVVLDLRTVAPEDDRVIAAACAESIRS